MKKLLFVVTLTLVVALLGGQVLAQTNYPTKPINLIIQVFRRPV